jgi:outer membrane protein OmpA-like peptidoglycan-associated protein
MPDHVRSRRLVVPLTVAAVGLAGIFLAEDLPRRHSIESQLTDRSRAALSQAGMSDVAVRFTGRDGTVSVLSAAQADKAREIVAGQEGVRVATVEVVSALPGTTQVVVGSPSPADAASPSPAPSPTASPSSTPSASPSPAPSAPTLSDLQKQIQGAGQIEFAFGSAVLTGDSGTTLARIAAILKANPGVRVRIEGNTDSIGDATANQALSEARAKAVSAALVRLGVDAGRMSTVGYGETHPLVSNSTADGRAKNRRVSFHLFQ